MDHTANFGRGQSMDKGQRNKQGDLVATKVMVTVQHQKYAKLSKRIFSKAVVTVSPRRQK